MTHYEVDYSTLEGEAKRQKALEDINDYLGKAKFAEVTKIVRDEPEPYTLDQFRMAVSFAGIQGYPAKAWWQYCYFKDLDAEE